MACRLRLVVNAALFVIMLVRMQRRMLRDGYVFAQVAREMRAATKVEEEVMHVAEIAGETAKAGLGAAKTAADCVVHTAAAVAAAAHIPDAVNNFGAAATHKVEDVIHVVSDKGTQATQAALSQTRKATMKATRAAKSAASHLVPEWWQHYIESALEAMPPPREWWKNPSRRPCASTWPRPRARSSSTDGIRMQRAARRAAFRRRARAADCGRQARGRSR